jgi:ABC-type uncharacterized transport system permease subunit
MLVAVAAVWFLMERTPFGYELKMLGANRKFAEYGGINTKRVIALSMAISGILAGLAGAHLSLGLLKRLTINLSPGWASRASSWRCWRATTRWLCW